jgi:hypothetical protein
MSVFIISSSVWLRPCVAHSARWRAIQWKYTMGRQRHFVNTVTSPSSPPVGLDTQSGVTEFEKYVRFEVFTALNMKNAVVWDIRTQFVPHRKHYLSTTEPRFLRRWLWRMPSSGILCRTALVRTGVSEERIASIIRTTTICDLRTTLVVTRNRYLLLTTDNRQTLQRNTILYFFAAWFAC